MKDKSWDTQLDDDMRRDFVRWLDELPLLDAVKVPRWLLFQPRTRFTVHTFCDASNCAYAAVVYLRMETEGGVQIRLLASKARVAPVKRPTIPRLELLAAVVAVRLTTTVVKILAIQTDEIFYWSDSSVVLSWIKRNEVWSTFVNNRIKEIRDSSGPTSWHYVPGPSNPADMPSRGCSLSHLADSSWWEGPAWIKEESGSWPTQLFNSDEAEVSRERRKSPLNKSVPDPVATILDLSTQTKGSDHHESGSWCYGRFSDYLKVVRLIGWMLRFARNCRLPNHARCKGVLKTEELENAELTLIRLVQAEMLSDVNQKKAFKSLSAFQDEDGIYRVRTKITYRQDEADFRQPILLPASHPVVRSLIVSYHRKHGHSRGQLLLNLLRERFWIPRGRKTLQAALRECPVCCRYEARALEVSPAPLPEDRVRDAAVFEVTGIDLTGPLVLKKAQKVWVICFTCAVYRAVHFELVTSLSADAFLQAFRKFIARRGRPSVVYTDNGTNFVGTHNDLKTIDWETIQSCSTVHPIRWKFNPPTAPWWGGWWERLIGLLKRLLRKVLGRTTLEYEEMSAVLCDCEAIINSRPLTYVSEDVSECVPLSPSLFLQDIREVGVPDLDIVDRKSLNRRLRYRQRLREDLRRRFRAEYLGQLLQPLSKNKVKGVKVGDVVLIGTDRVKRWEWPLARVVEILPDREGAIRLVRVRTASGELLRPLQRIFPLEIGNDDELCQEFQSRKRNRPPAVQSESVPLSLDNPEDSPKQDAAQGPVYVTRSGRHVRLPHRLHF